MEEIQRYFFENRFGYGDDYCLDSRDVIAALNSVGCFSVLAHPMSYGLEKNDIEILIKELANIGISGVEIYQPDCTFADMMYLKGITERFGLLYSVGSDFHRLINSDGRLIGRGINDNLCVRETTLSNKLLEKRLYYKGGR